MKQFEFKMRVKYWYGDDVIIVTVAGSDYSDALLNMNEMTSLVLYSSSDVVSVMYGLTSSPTFSDEDLERLFFDRFPF